MFQLNEKRSRNSIPRKGNRSVFCLFESPRHLFVLLSYNYTNPDTQSQFSSNYLFIASNMTYLHLVPGSLPGMAVALALVGTVLTESGSITIWTTNYIDTISGYDELSTCAEQVPSTVVRGQFSGCGDNNAVTSYTCFCTDSSSYTSAVISKDVMSSCPDSTAYMQASSALELFAAYCA